MMAVEQIAYIGVGSNEAHPVQQVQTALQELNTLPKTYCSKTSTLYKTKPIGPIEQPDFINAVAEIKTRLTPEQLLSELQQLENKHLRVREQRWGPRTLDLDLLLYDNLIQQTPTLTIPHPEMMRRAFVLVPLAEINPTLVLPNGASVQDLLKQLLAKEL